MSNKCILLFPISGPQRKLLTWGTWVGSQLNVGLLISAQVMDLVVGEMEPHVGLWADTVELVWDSLSLSLCPSLAHTLSK